MKTAKVGSLEEKVAQVVAFAILDAVKPLKARIAALEARPRGLDYQGVWRQGEAYQKGDAVTDHGGLWIADEATAARPGDPNSGWRLAVKSGALR